MTDSIPRTITVSLLLHLVVAALCLHFAGTEKAKPVMVDLSLFDLAGGAQGGAGKPAARQGGRSAAAGGFPLTAAASPPAPQVPKTASAVPVVKAAEVPQPAAARSTVTAERPVTAVARPAPAVPVQHVQAQAQAQAQAQPAAEKEHSAGPGSAGAKGEGASAGTSAGSPGQGTLSGKEDGASGAPGKGGANGSGIGSNTAQLQKKYLADHFAYILRIIQSRMVYPPKARREGLSGKARVCFIVLESGQVSDIKLLHSTGYEILDSNLVKTIKDAAPFPKPPIKAELQMTLSYRLDQ